MFAKVVEELIIYQIAVKLRDEVHQEMNCIRNNWQIKDVDQIKRSSSSISSNIAEGFGRRFYPKDYIRFLSLAIGSSDESQNHTEALCKGGFLSKEKTDYFKKSYKDLSIRTVNLRNSIRKKNNLK